MPRLVAILLATTVTTVSLCAHAQRALTPEGGSGHPAGDAGPPGPSAARDTGPPGPSADPDAASTTRPPPTWSRPAPEPDRERDFDAMFVWGAVALEVFGAGAVVWRIAVDPDSEILPEALVLSAPLPLSVPVGLLAYLGRWDVRIPLAVHGGAWTGAVLGLAGAMLDGARMGLGTTAETDVLFFMLGATGAFVGAAFGATQVEERSSAERTVWMAAPGVGMAVQFVVSIVYLFATWGGDGSNDTEQFLGWSTVATGIVGLGFAHLFVL